MPHAPLESPARVPRTLPPDEREFTSQQRAVRIYALLRDGRRMTTAEVAEAVGLTRQGALWLMDILTSTEPIAMDEGKCWYFFG